MAKIAAVIKYEGDNSTFVWKHPCEDFNTSTQLIVHESQEAVFFLNGQALDLFGPGRHTLETQNIPLLRHLINIPTDGETAFHCEVYFINKTDIRKYIAVRKDIQREYSIRFNSDEAKTQRSQTERFYDVLKRQL